MGYQAEADNGHDLIVEAINWTLNEGDESAPRGLKVREISAVPTILTLTNPSNPFFRSFERKPNYRFGMAEAMWIAAGSANLMAITQYNRQMAKFSDDGRTLWGAYGPRLMGQMPHVISTLKRDSDSRQAVAITWRPQVNFVAPDPSCSNHHASTDLRAAGVNTESDVASSRIQNDGSRVDLPRPEWDGSSWRSKDVPCTVSWQFMIRNGKLQLNVYMRSNDVWLGLPYDILSFTTIQRIVAGILNVPVGNYNHIVGSLHLYEDHWDHAGRILARPWPDIDVPELPPFYEFYNLEVADVSSMCFMVLDGDDLSGTRINGLRPYIATMRKAFANPITDAIADLRRGSR